jgi:hypothetical protein
LSSDVVPSDRRLFAFIGGPDAIAKQPELQRRDGRLKAGRGQDWPPHENDQSSREPGWSSFTDTVADRSLTVAAQKRADRTTEKVKML